MKTLTFGEELHQLREEKNISIRELMRKTGISNSYLSQLETGKRPRPSQEIIAKIGKVLGSEAYNRLMINAGYYISLTDVITRNKNFNFSDSIYVIKDRTMRKVPLPKSGYGKIIVTIQGGKLSTIKTEQDIKL